MMLKYCSIIITFCALETSKDLMAAFDDEHGDSEKSVRFDSVPPKFPSLANRSPNSNWTSRYENVPHGEPLGLPVWTRVSTPRYESPQVRDDFYSRDDLNAEQAHKSRIRVYLRNIKNKIRGFLKLN